MATRGTYRFSEAAGIIVYNHWDNYPMGAASHFIKAIETNNRLDLFSFVRGVGGAEIANSLYDGRAEYSYKVNAKDETVECFKVDWDEDKLHPHSSGRIDEWINKEIAVYYKNHPEEARPDGEVIIRISKGYYRTLEQVKAGALKDWERGKELTDKGQIGNGSSYFRDAFIMAKLCGDGFFAEQKKEYTEIYAPLLASAYNHSTQDHFLSYIEG